MLPLPLGNLSGEGEEMYLAMDEFGSEKYNELVTLKVAGEKWKRIHDLALNYGFAGVQINSKVYEQELGLSLLSIPNIFGKFRLSYHVGGVCTLLSAEDMDMLSKSLMYSLQVSQENGVEDVSFHPPIAPEGTNRNLATANLSRIIDSWLPQFEAARISLSMESHVAIPYFAFHGLEEFHQFVEQYPELGVLIDFSHNCFDGYSAKQVISLLEGTKITGLHLSDAQPGTDFQTGTHLPIGRGVVDFASIVRHFGTQDIFAALEVKGSSGGIETSRNNLTELLDQWG